MMIRRWLTGLAAAMGLCSETAAPASAGEAFLPVAAHLATLAQVTTKTGRTYAVEVFVVCKTSRRS